MTINVNVELGKTLSNINLGTLLSNLFHLLTKEQLKTVLKTFVDACGEESTENGGKISDKETPCEENAENGDEKIGDEKSAELSRAHAINNKKRKKL